jgi:Sulfotransferase domain
LSKTSLTPPRVVFIGGSGRSGSTLIERLLGELPSVCNVGEVVHLWERGLLRGETCGCGTPLPVCPFWTRVGEVAFGGWDRLDVTRFLEVKNSVDRNRYIFRLAASRPPGGWGTGGAAGVRGEAGVGRPAASWTAAGRAAPGGLPSRARWYADTYARLYAAIAQVSECQVVVDSSKHASLAFCLQLSADIDLRVLHVVRDSRAVAYSWTKRIRRPEAAADSDEYMPTFSPARSALLWNTLNLGFGLLSSLGVPVRQIRYEDFVADPPGSLAELAEFGCAPGDFSEVIAGFLARDRASLGRSHTASGNPMRFATGSIAFRADQTWREALHPWDRAVVSALTLPLLARYGYLRRPTTAAESGLA